MKKRLEIVLILDSIRSLYNVGSLLRTADGLGVQRVFTTGQTPYPRQPNDKRLPHVIARVEKQLRKTALGAEQSVKCSPIAKPQIFLNQLKRDGYQIIALEQTSSATPLLGFFPSSDKVALILGNEVDGVSGDLLEICDAVVEIEMLGEKNSFNVASAGAIAMFYLSSLSGFAETR